MIWPLRVLGGLGCLIGIVWILQGTNVLPGSFMTGNSFWTGMGALSFAIGTGVIVLSQRLARSAR